MAVFTGEDLAGDFASAAPDGLGPARRRDQDARALAAQARRGQARGRPGGRGGRPTTATARPGRGRGRDRRVRPASPPWWIPRRRSRTARRSSGSEFGTNKTHEWAVAGGDIAAALAEADVVVEQRVRQPPHLGRADRAARLDRRAARREPHALLVHPDPAHRALRCWPGCSSMPEDKIRVVAPDVGGGFGAKLQVYARGGAGARAGQAAGPAGQVDRVALGAHDHLAPRPRPGRVRDARRQAGRHAHRRARRGSWPTSAPTSSCSRRSSPSSASR